MTWKKKRPEGVPVSMESVRLFKVHSLLLKLTDQIDQVLDATTERVELPNYQSVSFTESVLRLGETGALGSASAHLGWCACIILRDHRKANVANRIADSCHESTRVCS
jgi:hypothetical protein